MSKLPFFLFSSLLASTSALALSCYDGSTDCIDAKQTADDCLKLGYSLNEPECEHYLLCSFNTDYKICVKEKTDGCPDGTMKKDGCTITNAVFTETNGNGCGTCNCPNGYTLSSDGKECTNTNLDQYGCPDGWTYITSESEITGSGKYCLGKSITLTQDHLVTLPSKSFEFTYATKKGFSTVTVAGGVTKLVSYTHVTIDNNGLAWVRELELHHGGTFKAPMDCGNETCEVKLYGAYPYSFANYLKPGTTNYATVSQCSSTNSCPVGITDCASGSAGMYLLFADTPSASKYSFGSGCASRCYNSSSSVNDLKYDNCGWMNGTNCNTSIKEGCPK